MIRATRFLRSALVSGELKTKFATTQFNNVGEMMGCYTELMTPIRTLRSTVLKMRDENAHLEWDIAQNKELDDVQRNAKSEKLAANKTEIEKIETSLDVASKELDTGVFEKILGGLATNMPEDVFSVAEVIGSEMNELKIETSPAVAESLRQIYFGDSDGNSEILFRYVERPASMFVLTGDINEMKDKLPTLFEERGTEKFDGRYLDRSKFEISNEPDNERKLLASMEAQK